MILTLADGIKDPVQLLADRFTLNYGTVHDLRPELVLYSEAIQPLEKHGLSENIRTCKAVYHVRLHQILNQCPGVHCEIVSCVYAERGYAGLGPASV